MSLEVESQGTQKSLVLVIGAGASFEAKLPLGSGLKKRISDLLDIRYKFQRESGDALIDQAFRDLVQQSDGRAGDINPYLHASWRIRDAMPQAISIDNFIDAHRGDSLIERAGKLAIVRSILEAEEKSSLTIDSGNIYNRLNFGVLQATWFNSFFQLLTENCQFESLAQRFARVGVVCFNYDRCIEHYLFNALQNYYGVTAEAAAQALTHLEIHHPYGTVGRLPWMGGEQQIAFGVEPSANQLVQLAERIRTFTEGSDIAESDISAVRAVLNGAERIAFLGFAFHRLNLELLFPPQAMGVPTRVCPVFATGVGISEADAAVVRQELFQLAGLNPNSTHIALEMPCSKLFEDYRRSLSLR
ncbi:hypothetical protein [Frateuria sp. STR12]|uniref:hypothetical protein n=1 Tax=Frateuria hangzhouensis TaxID=2995589 RepID=UPI002260821F|nr:hypothetical protein [Frateuria sp. STR12]MCX7513068.1 hypothetical protein [Frateuria sp. STR12]